MKAKKEAALSVMDVKVRDLMATAAAALQEGGIFLLAHEIRSDLRGVMALLETVRAPPPPPFTVFFWQSPQLAVEL